MLDYGYRSKCCEAPIKLGRKKIKKLNTTVNIWICTKCRTRDVDIVPKQGSEVQPRPFSSPQQNK